MSSLSKALFIAIFVTFLCIPNAWSLKSVDTDFSSILAPSANVINPIFGLTLYLRGQQLLINLYQHGNPEHPLIKIITTLFHHDTENEQIRPSASEANVAYGFGPYEVGWLLSLIICHPELFDDPELYLKKRNGKNNGKKGVGEKELDLFIKKLDEVHKKRVALENPHREKKKLRGTSAKKLLDFSNTTLRALQMGTGDCYNAEFVPLLFNAFACAKSHNKNDLFDFVVRGFLEHAIQKTQKTKVEDKYKAPIDEYLTPYGKKVLQSKKLQEQFIKEKTSMNEIEKTVAPYYTTLMVDTSLPQNILFAGTAYLLNLIQLPSKVSQLHIISHDNSPDCTEAAVLHLAAGIMFDNLKGAFTPKKLPIALQKKTPLSVMLEIFKHADLNNLTVRTLWFEFLSKRQNIIYKKGDFSLNARASNIFELLNQLFSINTTTWKELGAALSSPDVTIGFTGPASDDTSKTTMITMQKTYKNGGYYYTAISVTRDQHAAIIESKFEREQNDEQEKHIIFADRLIDIGMPPALYGAVVPLSTNDFQIKTIPHKKQNAFPLFLTLSRDLENRGFFELMLLADKNPGIKKLLSFDFINYNPDAEISEICADWLLKSGKYQEQTFWEFIVNNPEILIKRAFFQKNYAALHFFINTMLNVARIKSSTHERTLIRVFWEQIIMQYKNFQNSAPTLPDMQKNKPAPRKYLINQEQLSKILKKLLLRDISIETVTVKKKLTNELKNHHTLVKKIIEFDEFRTKNIYYFTHLYPHMLYILLETAITSKKDDVRENCTKFMLSDPAYLNQEIYQDETLCTLTHKYGDGFGIAKTLPEIKRAKAIKKQLIQKIEKLQKNSITQNQISKNANLALTPYIGK